MNCTKSSYLLPTLFVIYNDNNILIGWRAYNLSITPYLQRGRPHFFLSNQSCSPNRSTGRNSDAQSRENACTLHSKYNICSWGRVYMCTKSYRPRHCVECLTWSLLLFALFIAPSAPSRMNQEVCGRTALWTQWETRRALNPFGA